MTSVKMDRYGRVVIPKPIRDRLGMEPGDALEIETSESEIRLRPASGRSGLVKEKGIWVHSSESWEPYSIPDLIDQLREERISDLSR